VCAVGARSKRGINDTKQDTSSKTPLEKRLDRVGQRLAKFGAIAAGVILAVNLINFLIKLIAFSHLVDEATALQSIANYFTLAVTIWSVAVPEGLPLAVMLSLSYSVMSMKNDGVLVKNLQSPEVMAHVNEICTGKTGTLTNGNEMRVAKIYSQSLLINYNRKNTLYNCELFENFIDIMIESILFNCEASRIEMTEEGFWTPVGNGTEVGLIKMLQDADVEVQHIIKEKVGRIEASIPFSTVTKRSITAVRLLERSDIVRVFLKGAPELVVPKCIRTFENNGKI
jgi:magnesium-transporting ATPase (P-type)